MPVSAIFVLWALKHSLNSDVRIPPSTGHFAEDSFKCLVSVELLHEFQDCVIEFCEEYHQNFSGDVWNLYNVAELTVILPGYDVGEFPSLAPLILSAACYKSHCKSALSLG